MRAPSRHELPPGPRTPRALQTLRYGLDPFGFFAAAQRAHGDVFTVRVMAETWVVVAHPAMVREVHALGPRDADSGVANRSLRPLLGTRNLLLLDGEEHLRRRRLVLPPLHGALLRAYEVAVRDAAREVLAQWPLGVPAPVLPRLQAVTLQVVLRAVFGLGEGAERERLAAALRRLTTWTTDARRGIVFAFLGPDGLERLRGFRRQRAEVDELLLAAIAGRRAIGDLSDRNDVLSLLLLARDDAGEGLSDGDIRDELMTLLVAGHETTAAALAWALVELAREPAIQARLAAGEAGLAEAAVTETLRLHPPVPLGSLRRLRRPLLLAGRQLPAGATVATCSALVHRRPDVYDEAERWRPDRFAGSRPPAGAWLPFGGGVRRCAGAALAQFEARIVLEELVGGLELRSAGRPTARVGRRGIVLVPPGGGRLIATARQAAQGPIPPDPAEALRSP